MKDIIETGEYFNSDLIRNNRFAAGAIFYSQVVSMFFHGFFVRNQSTLPTSIELPDLLTATGVALLLLIGTFKFTQASVSFSVRLKIVSGLQSASLFL